MEYIWSLGGVYVESMYSTWTPHTPDKLHVDSICVFYGIYMEFRWSLCGVTWRPSGVNME
jgi:hypothetical protein